MTRFHRTADQRAAEFNRRESCPRRNFGPPSTRIIAGRAHDAFEGSIIAGQLALVAVAHQGELAGLAGAEGVA